MLQPVAGVEVDLPLPEPLEVLDAYLLPTFWNIWSEYRVQMETVGSSGLAPDIPTWAITLFSDPGFLWTSLRVQALSEALIIELRGQADVGQQQKLSDMMEDCGVPAEPSLPATKWGRCASLVPIIARCILFVSKLGHAHVTIGMAEILCFRHPFCSRRAFKPILGKRGPFLVCSRKNCTNSRDLTVEEWKKLPQFWQELWPVSWAQVAVNSRPVRPVKFLKSRKSRRRIVL